MNDMAARLGARLRRIREDRGLSVREVAEAAGLSPAYIVLIESGKRTPRLKTFLEKLAPAYQIDDPFAELAAAENIEDVPAVSICKDTPLESLTLTGPKGENLVYSVLPGKRVEDERMFVSYVELEGKSSSGRAEHLGEELLYIVTGKLDVTVGSSKFSLESGDLVHYKSDYRHVVKNLSDDPAKVLVIRYPSSTNRS